MKCESRRMRQGKLSLVLYGQENRGFSSSLSTPIAKSDKLKVWERILFSVVLAEKEFSVVTLRQRKWRKGKGHLGSKFKIMSYCRLNAD